MPFKAGRIGKHTQLIFIEARHSSYYLKHQLSPRSIRKTPMNSRSPRVYVRNAHFVYFRFHFIHSAALTQYKRHKLQVCNTSILFGRVILLIFAGIREIKQSGWKSGFIQPLGYKFLLFYGKADITVTSRKAHAVHTTVGCIGLLSISARHNYILAIQITARPLYGTCHNRSSILTPQSNARTSIRRKRNRQYTDKRQ